MIELRTVQTQTSWSEVAQIQSGDAKPHYLRIRKEPDQIQVSVDYAKSRMCINAVGDAIHVFLCDEHGAITGPHIIKGRGGGDDNNARNQGAESNLRN